MKILIAYDGSACADAALDDLCRAGLPRRAEALVLSVAEAWLPQPPPSSYEVVEEAMRTYKPADLERIHINHSQPMENAHASVKRAQARLGMNFPGWEVSAEGAYGSPAHEVIK